MPIKLAILVVHGMGSQTRDGFEKSTGKMIGLISGALRDGGVDPGEAAWKCGYWGDILQDHEDKLLRRFEWSRLDWKWLRHFVIDNLGDAVAYQRLPCKPDDFYYQIHGRLHRELLELRAATGNQDVPLLVMAHSLGSYIMSNYIWDRQSANQKGKPDPLGGTPFERMETLATIVTFGCNIAVLSLSLNPYIGLAFPPKELPPPMAAEARWLNFYDPDDVLGYPVKPLCTDYGANQKIEDHCIQVGGIASGWNPWSHDKYWTDSKFIQPAAKQIAALIQAASAL